MMTARVAASKLLEELEEQPQGLTLWRSLSCAAGISRSAQRLRVAVETILARVREFRFLPDLRSNQAKSALLCPNVGPVAPGSVLMRSCRRRPDRQPCGRSPCSRPDFCRAASRLCPDGSRLLGTMALVASGHYAWAVPSARPSVAVLLVHRRRRGCASLRMGSASPPPAREFEDADLPAINPSQRLPVEGPAPSASAVRRMEAAAAMHVSNRARLAPRALDVSSARQDVADGTCRRAAHDPTCLPSAHAANSRATRSLLHQPCAVWRQLSAAAAQARLESTSARTMSA